MKRSEMVNIISEFLEYWYGEDRPNKIADELLTKIENAGMTARYPNSYGFLDENNEVIMNDGWEKENE